MDINTMISILDEEVAFYTDAMNETEVYVEYRCANGAICFEPIKSKKFHAFLGVRYRELTQVLERPDYKELLAIKEEETIHMQDNQTHIYRRVAGNMNRKIVYFLSDPTWKSVIVTADGWRIGRNKKVKFLRYATDKPQVLPQKGGNYLDLNLIYSIGGITVCVSDYYINTHFSHLLDRLGKIILISVKRKL